MSFDADTAAARPINEKPFVLATDLDGTFLGGTDADRKRLYDWIEANRDTVGLIFVTGRDPEFIVEITRAQGVPQPEYVVGDVGTTIAEVAPSGEVRPIPALEEEISAAWADGGEKVREALEGHPGLTLQPTPFRHRVSYDLDPEAFDASAHSIVQAMGYDTLISADRYFDVLPQGWSKGPSLVKLLNHLGVPHERALAAGDTMNDLSMLALGLPAVAVGGSEAPLLAQVGMMDHCHKARAIGAAGILEAIGAFEMHPLG